MHSWLHKLLLILVTLAVAFAPLRGTLALPVAAAPAAEDHCAGMQHDPSQLQQLAQQDGQADGGHHDCQSGCNGSCCDQDCSTCLHHATVGLPASVFALRDAPARSYAVPVADSFPERPPTPLLRPPLLSRS